MNSIVVEWDLYIGSIDSWSFAGDIDADHDRNDVMTVCMSGAAIGVQRRAAAALF